MKVAEQLEAVRLRQSGWAIKPIARELKVSPGSVSRWVRHVQLSPEQEEQLRRSNPIYTEGRRRGTEIRRRRASEKRRLFQEIGRAEAQRCDLLHLTGCMLYWAEGAKYQNAVSFANSDPGMMRLFARFLRCSYAVPDERIILRVHCFLNNGPTLWEIEEWWLEQVGLPRSSLRKSVVNKASRSSSRHKRTLVYGTAQIRVHSTEIVQRIFGSIQEYTAVQRPEWLDCNPPPLGIVPQGEDSSAVISGGLTSVCSTVQ